MHPLPGEEWSFRDDVLVYVKAMAEFDDTHFKLELQRSCRYSEAARPLEL